MLLLVAAGAGLTGCAGVHAGALGSDPPTPLPSAAPVRPSASAADPMDQAPAIPRPRPGAVVDASAQAKADRWLAGAKLPPAAFKVVDAPAGTTIDDQSQGWWCEPMAHAEAYWKVPGMNLSHTADWLSAHPSNGLKIIGPAHVAVDPNVTNASVFDFPDAAAFQGMTFSLASWGRTGSVIHLQIGVLAHDSVCATPPPGSQLGTAGG